MLYQVCYGGTCKLNRKFISPAKDRCLRTNHFQRRDAIAIFAALIIVLLLNPTILGGIISSSYLAGVSTKSVAENTQYNSATAHRDQRQGASSHHKNISLPPALMEAIRSQVPTGRVGQGDSISSLHVNWLPGGAESIGDVGSPPLASLRPEFVARQSARIPMLNGAARANQLPQLSDRSGLIAGARQVKAGVELQLLGSGVSVWYRQAKGSLEQGFTLAARPIGSGKLVLGIETGGIGLVAGGNGTSLEILGSGRGGLWLRGLSARDSSGRSLPIRFRVSGRQIQIVMDDRGALYPVTIDPWLSPLTSPQQSISDSNSAPGDLFGGSVSMSEDGQIALVGAPGNSGGTKKGIAYIFKQTSGSWNLTAALSNSAGASGDLFGSSTALSGDGTVALVGAPGVSGGARKGAAYIYESTATGWINTSAPKATLTNTASAPGDLFGGSVALSFDGQIALIGAGGVSGGLGKGAAYVYQMPATGWASATAPKASLSVSTAASGDQFGNSVALSGDGQTALISAQGVSGGAGKGAAYIFSMPFAGWANATTPTATLTNGSGLSGDLFGCSVALSNDGQVALVGAQGTSGGLAQGAGYVYAMPATGWANATVPTATLTNSAGVANDALGVSVALSGDGQVALLGAQGVSGGVSKGSAYLFSEPSSGWASLSSPTETLSNGSGSNFDDFGVSVSLSYDGQISLVGAQGAPGGLKKGAIYFFSPSANNSWDQKAVLSNSSASNNDMFGDSVSLSYDGQTALVGAQGVSGGVHKGAAYVFSSASGSWVLVGTLTNSTGSNNDFFGDSVALSADGHVALIGAAGVSAGLHKGAAYIYAMPSGGWSSSTTPKATLSVSTGASSDNFGGSVALSSDGQFALIGAPGVSAGAKKGAAYIFQEPSTGWANSTTPKATISNTASASGDSFGTSVAFSSDEQFALIGAPGVSGGLDKGAAYIYQMPSTGWANTTAPKASLSVAAGSNFDNLGISVALSADGETALVGADGYTAGDNKGSAYIFSMPFTGWANATVPTAVLSNLTGSVGDQFGSSVALSVDGQTAAIGANGVSAGASQGAAYIYEMPSSGWTTSSSPSAVLTNQAGANGDRFGSAIAISSNGQFALVGAYGVPGGTSKGSAYAYNFDVTPPPTVTAVTPSSGSTSGGT